MIDFARARKVMVDTQLRTSSITDRRLLAVMGEVPRERFVPENRRDLAYIDDDIPLGGSVPRALSAPAPFARLVQLAAVQPSDRVLDLGCGTGYSTAVLAGLAAAVLGIEPEAALAEQARASLSALGIANAEIRVGATTGTGIAGASFDVVIVESIIERVPTELWNKLHDHGRLVAIIGSGMTATAHIFVKTGKDIAGRADFNARLPALGPSAQTGDFVF